MLAAGQYRKPAGPAGPERVVMEKEYTAEYVPPISERRTKSFLDEFPKPREIGVGLAASFYRPDLAGAYNYIRAVEAKYRAWGYPIPQYKGKARSVAMASVSMRVWYWRWLAGLIEMGSGVGGDSSVAGLAASILCLPGLPVAKWIRPYVGTGVGYWQFWTEAKYGANTNGYPARITAAGGSWGILLRQGIQLWPPGGRGSFGMSASFYLDYLFAPDIDLKGEHGVTGTASLNGSAAGIRIEAVF